MNLLIDLAVVVLLVAFGCWQWRAEGLSGSAVAAFGFAAALLLIILSGVYVVPLVAYLRDEKLKRPYHLRFAEDGIEFRTDNLDSRLGWELYTKALIDRHSYLLYHGKSQFTIVPKHVLPNDDSRQEFERLLKSKIATVVRR